MNKFKAYRLADLNNPLKRGDIISMRNGKRATFAYVADNGNIATQEKGMPVFLLHPSNYYRIVVRSS